MRRQRVIASDHKYLQNCVYNINLLHYIKSTPNTTTEGDFPSRTWTKEEEVEEDRHEASADRRRSQG